MLRKDINLQDQLAKCRGWKDPLVDAVVATICHRKVPGVSGVLDQYEFLVTERVRGAEKGQFQAHHGGFMKVTDRDLWHGGSREVEEETGYAVNPNGLYYITSTGPGLFRSEMEIEGDRRVHLHITEEEAEPQVAFVLPLFMADLTGIEPHEEIDGEVKGLEWLTGREIIGRYGSKGDRPYSQFNYFHLLVMGMLDLSGQWRPGSRPISMPGKYSFQF